MNKNEMQPEILAPAGNMLSLKTAIHNGADAVYLGLGLFNARAKAENFNLVELEEALNFAHLYGVRVYVAFNTLIKSSEIKTVADMIARASILGVDAFILQDLGLLHVLQQRGIKTEFHASTQMGIHNLEGAVAAEKIGFKRVILSRETTLSDIEKIRKGTALELEFFVHGALCVAFSGNCYMSSILTGESGNRGKCLQFCRKPYTLLSNGKSVQNGYLLSARDLCLAQQLNQLKKAGISSFKIEGRMRRPEYIGETVYLYKRALHTPLQKNDINHLKMMFNRGDYCEAYLTDPTANVVDKNHPAHIGLKIGKVINADKTIQIQYDKSQKLLLKADGIKFMRNGKESGSALIRNPNEITFLGDVKVGDEVRVTSCAELNIEVLKRVRKIELTARAEFIIGKCAEFTVSDGGVSAIAYSANPVQASVTAPLTQKNLDILYKTGDNMHTVSDIALNLCENCFLPVSEIKAMRRDAIEKFRVDKLASYHAVEEMRKKSTEDMQNGKEKSQRTQNRAADYFSTLKFMELKNQRKVFVSVCHAKDVTDALLKRCNYVVLNPPEYALDAVRNFVLKAGTDRAVLNLPNIMRQNDAAVLRSIIADSGVENFVVNNLYGLELCCNKTVIAGFQMNFLNNSVPNITKVFSVEAEKRQEGAINYIYGRIPLMTLTYCPRKNLTDKNCHACADQEKFSLTDERGAEFPLQRKKTAHCYWELLNSLPLDNREVLCYTDSSVWIDLAEETDPAAKLAEILDNPHSNIPHTHGNYKRR